MLLRTSLILLFGVFIFTTSSDASMCYSCSGTCHSEPCNCQMGSCESNHCYIEKRPTEVPGVMKITKGCLRRPHRLHTGCEYDHFSDHLLCVCHGKFCNDIVFMRTQRTRNVTCRECTEKNPDCDNTCIGHWCHEDSTTGATGCGYGPPAMPFFYRGPEMFYYRSKICATFSRGAGKPRHHCICNQDMCNSAFTAKKPVSFPMSLLRERESVMKSRSLVMSTPDNSLKMYTCTNCEINSQDGGSITSSCKQNKCVGHFCTYASQRHFRNTNGRSSTMVSMSELQGCLNVSDSTNVQLGCSRKWMSDEFEEFHCACRGDGCNRDPVSASVSSISILLVLSAHILAVFID